MPGGGLSQWEGKPGLGNLAPAPLEANLGFHTERSVEALAPPPYSFLPVAVLVRG